MTASPSAVNGVSTTPGPSTGFLKKGLYKTYWENTSSNSLVSYLIRQGRPDVKMTINQLYGNRDAIWSLLLTNGYLRVEGRHFDLGTGIWTYTLKLTNKDVAIIIKRWFSGGDVPYNEFLKALL